MKKLLFLLFVVISVTINAQVIDWKKFDEKVMNKAVFEMVSHYITSTVFRDINGEDVNGLAPKIYNPSTDKNGSRVEVSDKIRCKKYKTYQTLANRCIEDWEKEGTMPFLLWCKTAEITSNYKKINRTVYIRFISR